MSAYMVSTSQIDALLTAGLSWEQDPLRWTDRGPTAAELAANAHASEPTGDVIPSNSMAWYRAHMRELTKATAGRVGAMLLAENRASVNYRYTEEEWEEPYTFWEYPGVPDAVGVLKLIDNYEYQACEHPEWEVSEAARFCAALRGRAINHLPDYDAAPWGIDGRDAWTVKRRA